jgi:ribosomal protein L11 methyltransferase
MTPSPLNPLTLNHWHLTFTLPAHASEFINEALAGEVLAITTHAEEEDTEHRIELLVDGEPDIKIWSERLAILLAAIGVEKAELQSHKVEDKNWLREVQQSFVPMHIGRFYVHGTHITDIPKDVLPICIDAGLAFGSGEHHSTRGCLMAIDARVDSLPEGAVLDVGCGSGILAIALAKAGRKQVVASDIDPTAVSVARDNAIANQVPHIHCITADGLEDKKIQASAPYQMVVANILASPLMQLAPSIARVTVKGGVIILAGLLTRQAPDVLAAYEKSGCRESDRYTLDEWTTLVLQKATTEA